MNPKKTSAGVPKRERKPGAGPAQTSIPAERDPEAPVEERELTGGRRQARLYQHGWYRNSEPPRPPTA